MPGSTSSTPPTFTRPANRKEIVGEALKGRRDDVVLATKFWGSMGDDPNRRGVSRRWIITEVDNSLRRLGTDWIDSYHGTAWAS
jgi:aryl-alcohol dehydrogenase-like predicted oxidoreductase